VIAGINIFRVIRHYYVIVAKFDMRFDDSPPGRNDFQCIPYISSVGFSAHFLTSPALLFTPQNRNIWLSSMKWPF
jgi:hypothetical protein